MIEKSIDTAIEISFSLGRRLDELKYKDYPSNTSIELIDVFKLINEDILNNLIKRKDVINNPPVDSKNKSLYEDSVRRQIIIYNDLLFILHNYIQFVEESSTDHISLGTTYPIEAIIKKFKPKYKFILVPVWQFNFFFFELTDAIKETFSNLIPNLEDKLCNFKDGLAILSFPSTEKNNIFLHCVLSHEIGHFFVSNSEVFDSIISDVEIDEQLLDSIVNKISSQKLKGTTTLEDFMEKSRIRADIIEKCIEIIESWINELASDLFAIHIFGPSYLFVSSKIMLDTSDINYDSKGHPSSRYRMNLILRELDEIGYYNLLKKRNFSFTEGCLGEEVLSEIKKIKNSIDSIKPIPSDELFAICYEAIEKKIPDLQKQVRLEVKNAHADFDVENFQKEIPYLISSMEHFIPPNEILDCENQTSRPSNLISILNAGWIYYLTRKEDFFKQFEANTLEKRFNMVSKLNDMILKAIELSQAHEMWLKSINDNDGSKL